MPANSSAPASTTERPMRADARRNYDRLVVAAREILAERGGDMSLEQVAQCAGVGIGTLYRHFPSRLDLLEAVYRADIEALAQRADALIASEPAWDALEQWMHVLSGLAVSKRNLFHELIDAIGKDSELLTHSRQVIGSSAEKVLHHAQEAGVARADVEASDLIRLVSGCTMMPHLEAGQAERMLAVVLAGLRT